MDLTHAASEKITQSWWLLKITYGLLFVIAGADKFFNLVTQWEQYVSPHIFKVIPVSLQQLMFGVAAIEIVIGLLILAGTSFMLTRLGAYLAVTWLLVIVVNLLSMGTYFDIAVRDTVMAIGAFVLALLCDVKEELA